MEALTTKARNILLANGITNMKELYQADLEIISSWAGIGKTTMVAIMKLRGNYVKSLNGLKVPKKVYKKAVKTLVQAQFNEDVIKHIHKVFVEQRATAEKTMTTLINTDVIKALKYTTFVQYASHAEPKPKSGKEAFAIYRLCDTIVHLQLFVEAATKVLKSDKFASDMRSMVISLTDVFGKNKKEEVILNSIVPRIGTVYDMSIKSSLVIAEMMVNTGLFTRKLVTTDDGARDFMVSSNIDYSELKELWSNSSDRVIQTNMPDTAEGKTLVNRSKIQYNQEINADVAESIDYITQTEMKLVLPRDKVIEMVSLKLFGEIGGEFKETWEKQELKSALSEYDYIMANDGKFYVDATTDSIFRLYCKSNNFSVQSGHWLRQYIEFSHTEVLNENGIKWMKLVIAGQNGYDKATEEDALEAYRWNHMDWFKQGKSAKEFNILFNPHRPTGYQIELDAQSQSFQIYGQASASLDTLKSVGYGQERVDFRDNTAMVMNHLTDTNIWNKNNLKSCVMNKAYTAGKKTVLWGQQSKDTEHLTLVETKRQIPLMSTVLAHNKGKKHDEQLSEELVWESFSKALKATAYDSVSIMESMQSVLKDAKVDSMDWTLANGAVCEVIFQDTVKKHFKWASADGHIHTLTHAISEINQGKAYNSIPPRMIQGEDAYDLMRVASKMKAINAPFAGVFDGYITHPNYCDAMCEFYREQGVERVETNSLSHSFYDATGTFIDFQSTNKKDIDEVIELIKASKYALWL